MPSTAQGKIQGDRAKYKSLTLEVERELMQKRGKENSTPKLPAEGKPKAPTHQEARSSRQVTL